MVAAGGFGGPPSPTCGLLYELGAILSALMLGILAVRLKLVVPERGDMTAMGFITGSIALPLLLFKTVATSRLEGIDLGVILACSLGKALIMAIAWAITYFAYKLKTQSRKERFLTASVFSLVAVLTNDFALAFPVIEALYGQEMTAYVAMNAVVGAAFFVPLGSVLLAVGSSLPDEEKMEPLQQRGDGGRSHACADFVWLLRIIRGALMNNIVGSAFLGLLYKLIFCWTIVDDGRALHLPFILDKILSLFTSPFGMCSLFMTGTNVRSVKLSMWPFFLVVCKVVVVAFLTYQLSTVLVQRDDKFVETTNISFFYGTVPTSATPIILGSKFAPASTELVATAIVMAVFVSGIIMYLFAVNAMNPGSVSMRDQLAVTQKNCSILSVASMAVVATGVLVLTLRGRWGWSRPGKQMLAALGASIVAYQSAMLLFDELLQDSEGSLCSDWSALLVVITFFQNATRLLVLGFPVLILRWGPRRLGAADSAGCDGLVLIALALVGSGVLCRLVYPNAVMEVCGAAAEAAGRDPSEIAAGVQIWPINLVDQLLFWSMLALMTAIACQRRGGRGGRQPSEGKGAEAAEEGAEPGVGGADEEMDAPEDWLETPPRGLFRMLMLAQALRTLQQVINSSQVLNNAMINGGFVTMLIIEYFLEHGQGFILLVGLAFDTNFMNATAQAITGMMPWVSRFYAITWSSFSPLVQPKSCWVGPTCEFAPDSQESVAAVMSKTETLCSSRQCSVMTARSSAPCSMRSSTPENLRPGPLSRQCSGPLSRQCTMQLASVLEPASELHDPEGHVSPRASGLGPGLHREYSVA